MWGAAWLHQHCGDGPTTQARAEAAITLATEEGFTANLPIFRICWGWALAEQGHLEAAITEMSQGLADYRAVEAKNLIPYHLALFGEVYGKAGQIAEGFTAIAEALAAVGITGERTHEAELYRLKGTLTLQSKVQGPKSKVEEEAEECFQKAIKIARRQQAKSLELRATVSLARLWQQQGKHCKAHKMLSEIYNWFTEGFDTKDLQEAKALLQELA